MSSVCDLGTIRNIIRGVDEPLPYMLLSEMIDDAEHSLSKRIFIDINVHDKHVIFGFENAATEEQLNNMVHWNPTSKIHNTSHISTCGQGLKYYEFRFRGEQIHATKTWDESNMKFIYRKSSLNSDIIYNNARSADVSETVFSDILKKKTSYVNESDEIEPTLDNIFLNKDNKYPFQPETIIVSKNITNDKLLEYLNIDDNIKNLRKELTNKYYSEIKNGELQLYIKFPNEGEFCKIGDDCDTDVIGSTVKQREHVIELYYILHNFRSFKKGDYIISINNIYFKIQKNGNSFTREVITLLDDEKLNILLQFEYIQYNIPSNDSKIKQYMVGSSMEDYCGIYLKIGDKFIDSKPITCNLTKRNLPGAKNYRAILQLMNPKDTKMMLGIHGLKPEFNLSHMASLEQIIKQCCIIYKSFSKYESYKDVDPTEYCIVKTSNEKSKRTSKPGNMYLRVVGKNFYKLGMTTKTNRAKRIFDKMSAKDFTVLKNDFPEEDIYPFDKQYYEYLSPEFDKCSSTDLCM